MERLTLRPGERFGRLTAVREAGYSLTKNGWKLSRYEFKCDCGKTHVTLISSVKRGIAKSCGCLRSEWAIANKATHGATRGGKWTPEYKSYAHMLDRCKPNNSKAQWYAERGISVCSEWSSSIDGGGYERFLAHIGPKPSPKHSLDRIDNDRGYEPGNVRWATVAEQLRNRTDNRMLSVDGRILTLTDAAKLYDINFKTLWTRLDSGWPVDRALNKRPRAVKPRR